MPLDMFDGKSDENAKAVIYLDQLVVSNITKALDPDSLRRERVLKDPFWLNLYKKLDRLLKLQLIVCPDSYYHRAESLLSTDPPFDSLQDVYSHLSNDCTFQDANSVLRWQVLHHFRSYLDGRPEDEPLIAVDDIVSGDLNEWQDPIRISVPYRSEAREIELLRLSRRKNEALMTTVFPKWQDDRSSFQISMEEEGQELGRALIREFFLYVEKSLVHDQTQISDPLDWLPTPAAGLIFDMIRMQEEYDLLDPFSQLDMVGRYLASAHFLRVPFVRLSSMLFAALARKAQAGQRRPPGPGTITDVSVIASILPYCHAMFVDREMAAHLREGDLRKEVERFGTQVFSLSAKARFLSYLDDLEKRAGPMHVTLVEHVYGRGWLDPYLGVVAEGKRRRARELSRTS